MLGSLRSSWRQTTPGFRRFFVIWCAVIVGVTIWATIMLRARTVAHVTLSKARHEARMSGGTGTTQPDAIVPASSGAVAVRTGMYVEGISEIVLAHASWSVEFLVWFTWEGPFELGDNFTIVDGVIDEKVLLERTDLPTVEAVAAGTAADSAAGGSHYARYKVRATIAKQFDGMRFPQDEHLLTVSLEFPQWLAQQMVLVPDTTGTALSSRASVAGYQLGKPELRSILHGYKSAMGKAEASQRLTYSQVILGLSISRGSSAVLFGLFFPLYVGILLALLGLLLKSAAECLGMALTAVFIFIWNGGALVDMVPNVGQPTMVSTVTNICYIVLAFVMVQAVISQHQFDESPEGRLHARWFSWGTMVFLGLGAFVLNAGFACNLLG